MTGAEYQRLASRTELDQKAAAQRMWGYTADEFNTVPRDLTAIRLNHAVVGLTGEAGELAAALEKFVYYGQPLDLVNCKDELGDALWYIALACNALGLDLSEVMAANIRKLKVRYPEKYETDLAMEVGRNRRAERTALEEREEMYERLEQNGHGWAEPVGSDE